MKVMETPAVFQVVTEIRGASLTARTSFHLMRAVYRNTWTGSVIMATGLALGWRSMN